MHVHFDDVYHTGWTIRYGKVVEKLYAVTGEYHSCRCLSRGGSSSFDERQFAIKIAMLSFMLHFPTQSSRLLINLNKLL